MALHQLVQRILLIGSHRYDAPAPKIIPPPPALVPLIASLAAPHRTFNERAIRYGHRYRSGYWMIYLLSAIAVLFAVMPLALGWDDSRHVLHPFIGVWAVCEVIVILTVGATYWLGHRHDWQGQWLHARTTAELTWYLPLVAPLLDFERRDGNANWYLRVFDPGQHLRSSGDVEALCIAHEDMARELQSAWSDPTFVRQYATWAMAILDGQRHYHQGVAIKQHALLHRVHGLNIGLFGLTGLAACMHLLVHTVWLSLVTTFFPALGASLHGALAQSEAYRLSVTSERLVAELKGAGDEIRTALQGGAVASAGMVMNTAQVKTSIQSAMALILEEHQDWHMLVRPHRLPLG